MSGLVHEKAEQAIGIMRELEIDAWLTFVRETTAVRDPVLSLIYGPGSLTWQSALLFSSQGERVAIVGHYEAHAAEQTGVFDRVIGYHESLRAPLRRRAAAVGSRGKSRSTTRWTTSTPTA